MGDPRQFLTSERGAARTQTGFAIAAAIGVAVVSAYFLLTGGQPQIERVRMTPTEVAMQDLMSGNIRQFTSVQVRQRLATYLDTRERTDAQLRNAHRNWARRAADPTYQDPDLAHDMNAIISAAMELRGVRPHTDI
jgi:hypothetical protein